MDRDRRRDVFEKAGNMHAQQCDMRTDTLRRMSVLPHRQDQQINLLPVWKIGRDRDRDGDRAGR